MFGSRDDSRMDADQYSVGPKSEFVGINDGIKSRIRMINLLTTVGKSTYSDDADHPIFMLFRVNTHRSLFTRASVSAFRYLTPRGILGNSVDRPNAGVGY